jgi:hypothetical protein
MAAYTGKVPPIPKSKLLDNGHWSFPEQMGEDIEAVGFIYVIRDNYMNRFYLGKKFLRGTGKINKGQPSNWRRYTSSSDVLKEMFSERSKDEFSFFCLEEYHSKGALAYAETWSLCHVEAVTTPEWYNKRIEEVSWKVSEKVTARHKERLARIINGEFFL